MSDLSVIDANVVLSGLRSRNGAAHLILRGMLTGEISFAASPAVVLEYEDLLSRPGVFGEKPWITHQEIDRVLDGICLRAVPVVPWFRFRPFLEDPKDDLYIECALAAGSHTIITHDRHFRHPAVSAFGLTVLTAAEFATAHSMERGPK